MKNVLILIFKNDSVGQSVIFSGKEFESHGAFTENAHISFRRMTVAN